MGKPRGPNMTATLERITVAAPGPAHYAAVLRRLAEVGVDPGDVPRDFLHVRELAVWVDTVLWCFGDQHARGAVLDRLSSKAARVIVTAEMSQRKAVALAAGIPDSESDAYMASLETPLPEEEDEDVPENGLYN